MGNTVIPSPMYDVRTKYSNLFGGLNYILKKDDVKQKLKNFLRTEMQK